MKKANWLLALASTLLTLLAVEIALNKFANANSRPAFTIGHLSFDSRAWLDVLYDLTAAGVESYPVVSADTFGQSFLKHGGSAPFMPLAGRSKSLTIFCNEIGRFIVYASDRYGFRNPDGIWDAKPPVMLVGDSFSHGACVPDDATVAANLIRMGLPTVSAAYDSNGLLAELASLIEYGGLMKPRLVLWLYHEGNDLTDLGRELRYPILRKYLDPGFNQNLPHRQADIDRAIEIGVAMQPAVQAVREAAKQHWGLSNLLLLRNTRALAALAWRETFGRDPDSAKRELDDVLGINIPARRFADFGAVLTRAKEVTESWGGRMVFAYLPASERYRFPDIPELENLDTDRAEVLRIAAGLGLPVIDLGAVIAARTEPARLYPRTNWTVHFNEEGYRVISSALADRLRPLLTGPR